MTSLIENENVNVKMYQVKIDEATRIKTNEIVSDENLSIKSNLQVTSICALPKSTYKAKISINDEIVDSCKFIILD